MENKIKNNRKRSLLLIGFILILIVSIMGGTYAYLAFSASNNSVVVGEIGVADLDLRVTKVTTNNGELVPQLEKALGTAVSSSHNCVDGNGNAVCQVYKIEIENTGTAKVVVDGTIDFTNTTLPNLKYKLMTNSTTLDTTFNSRYGYGDMEDRPMVRGVSLEPEQVETYYIVFWINDTESEQPDTGTYRANINFNSSYMEGLTSTYVNYLVGFSGENDTSYFHNTTYSYSIKNASFVNYIDTSDAVVSWDMGTLQNGGIMAWLENNTTSGYYDLYIGSTETIRGLDMSYYFAGLIMLDNISFDNLDTSEVVNMNSMFAYSGYNSTTFKLDLGDKFDTSKVTNMYGMFYKTGYDSTEFTLDLGDKFDTSKVTNMSGMFYETGVKSSMFTLDLVEKFDTSNVIDMSGMFYSTAAYNTEFTLDLGDKFDTSNVITMYGMFYLTGHYSTEFMLDLGDKFDTSSVTNMNSMFYGIAANNTTILTLDLGDKFDTSNVIDMSYMFYATGRGSTEFMLDLTRFTFDNLTNYTDMFYNFKTTQKIYVKNASDKAWLIGKGFSGVTNNNVIVRS